jgi:hypothetical protein
MWRSCHFYGLWACDRLGDGARDPDKVPVWPPKARQRQNRRQVHEKACSVRFVLSTPPEVPQSSRSVNQNPRASLVVVGVCDPAGPDGQAHGSCSTRKLSVRTLLHDTCVFPYPFGLFSEQTIRPRSPQTTARANVFSFDMLGLSWFPNNHNPHSRFKESIMPQPVNS